MICDPCKNKQCDKCPTMAWDDPKKPKTGLSEENNKIQRSGLCPCQHRGFEKALSEEELHAQIHKSRNDIIAVGIVPPPCPYPECNEKEATSEQLGGPREA